MLTEDDLEQRLNFVTGSDAAVICGLSPYKTKLQLWMEKTKRIRADDISDLNHIKFGNFMEDGVAKWFEHDSGKKLYGKPELRIHKDHAWMAGNADFLLSDENAILECKTAFSDKDWGNGENIIPAHYLAQVAHYCAVLNKERAYIAVVFAQKREMRWYQYDRNIDLERKIIAHEMDFWFNHVQKDIAPEPVSEQDILALYKETDSKPFIADDEVYVAVKMLERWNKELKKVEESIRHHKEIIQLKMLDKDTLVDLNGKMLATWKYTKPIESFDKRAFKAENPELYEKYKIMGDPQRRFKITGVKDE